MNKKIDELQKELEEERKFIRELYGILLSSTDRDAFTQSSYAVLNRLRLWVNRDFDRIAEDADAAAGDCGERAGADGSPAQQAELLEKSDTGTGTGGELT